MRARRASAQLLNAGRLAITCPTQRLLLGAQARTGTLPVCDHYSGVEARMRKSLALQEEMTQEFGACVFDVTLDCEDGAPVGGEAEHAALVVELALGAKPGARVAVRVHPVDHPAFESDIATIAGKAGHRLVHIMLPKVERREDVERASRALHAAGARDAAAARADRIARRRAPRLRHRRASAHAVPQLRPDGLRVGARRRHPLGRAWACRASSRTRWWCAPSSKYPSACHAHGKVPSHGVVTEFKDRAAFRAAASRAANEFGYTRMWSIHPDQIRTIVEVFAPVG